MTRKYSTRMPSMPFLSREEEARLGRRMHNGKTKAIRQDARKRLIESCMRLVPFLVSKYAQYDFEHEDLVQAGNEGLIFAVDRFDPDKGRLGTYAGWWIQALVMNYMAHNWSSSSMTKSRAQCGLYLKINRARQVLLTKYGERDDLDRLIAKRVGKSERQVKIVIQRFQKDVSLDAHKIDSVRTLHDELVSDVDVAGDVERVVYNEKIGSVVDSFLADASNREVLLVRERLMNGARLAQLGKTFGISRERVRQIEVGLKVRLKVALLGVA